MSKIQGATYKPKSLNFKGHKKFAITMVNDFTVSVICADTKEDCVFLAKKAGFIGEINKDKIQEVVIVGSDNLSEI